MKSLVISNDPKDLMLAFKKALAEMAPSTREAKAIFESSGLTAEQAAQRMGMHPYYVRQVAKGRQVIKSLRRRFTKLETAGQP